MIYLRLRILSPPTPPPKVPLWRGPQVVVGADPGVGGMKVPPGRRGLAARHCTLTAYDTRTVWLTPIGGNPVRVAEYVDADWDAIPTLTGPVRLERGFAVHLGPTGRRGVIFELVECEDLGGEEIAHPDSGEEWAPESIHAEGERPTVRQILAEGMPERRFRTLAALLFGGSAALFAVALLIFLVGGARRPEVIEPEFVHLAWGTTVPLHEGMDRALYAFLIEPDRAWAGRHGKDPEGLSRTASTAWDDRFTSLVQQNVERLAASPGQYRLLDEARPHFTYVLGRLRQAGLPEALAAIPLVESGYSAGPQSSVCARGWWQFMPEFGARYADMDDFGDAYRVARCRLDDDSLFTPTLKTPPPNVRTSAVYVDAGLERGRCRILRCEKDFRDDLERSTDVALHALGEVFEDPELGSSGAALQIAIASHYAGFDDGRWPGVGPKSVNLLPSFRRWQKERGDEVSTAHFLGDASLCGREVTAGCEAYLKDDVQKYPTKVFARFLLAVCHYATNHPEDPAFASWQEHVRPGGYCSALPVRSRGQVRVASR